jgi:hypothetical protein
LLNKQDILFRNERQINILETRNFGRLAFVEVGALSVGRIVQLHALDSPFQRGEEKSVFRFGGSAIVVFGEPGIWRPSDDLLEHTKEGIETLVRLGEPVGRRASPTDGWLCSGQPALATFLSSHLKKVKDAVRTDRASKGDKRYIRRGSKGRFTKTQFSTGEQWSVGDN